MVGVGAGQADLPHGIVHGHALLGEQADQFWNDHGGVGIVDLHRHMLMEGIGGVAPFSQFFQDQLGRAAHQEILLVDTQQPPGVVAVVGVKEEGQGMGNIALVEGDALPDAGFIHRIHIKQMQGVALAVVAGHRNVVHDGVQAEPAERHREPHAGIGQPALGGDPGVLFFFLLVVFQLLVEQAVVVVQPGAVAAKAQRGNGIQEAGRQPSQAAVAQGGFVFRLLNGGQFVAVAGQQVFGLLKQAQVDEVVAQQFADEKFRRYIVQLAVSGGLGQGRHFFFGKQHQRLVNLTAVGGVQGFAKLFVQNFLQSLFHGTFPLFQRMCSGTGRSSAS